MTISEISGAHLVCIKPYINMTPYEALTPHELGINKNIIVANFKMKFSYSQLL